MQSGRCEIHCKFTRFSPANTFRKLNTMKNARHRKLFSDVPCSDKDFARRFD